MKTPPLSDMIASRTPGGVAEWLKAPVLKTGMGLSVHLGFESRPHR
jgi:hypothetical protein